jgi:hypothetical protein
MPPADALDLYVATNGTVRIIDFNPIADTTSPLLFTWEQLPYSWPRPAAAAQADASEAAAAAAAAAAEGATSTTNGHAQAAAPAAASEEDEGSSSEAGSDSDLIDFRVVGDAGMVQPGARQACGMPFDMLSLQDVGAIGDIISMMQQQKAEP